MDAARRGMVWLAVLCATVALTAQSALPIRLSALDQFPPPAKDALGRAFAQAQQKPGDPQAVGALGRVLHAWEQWDAAHEAYQRAQALAPEQFAWHYLDGVVLQRLARHGEAVAPLRRALALDPAYDAARVKLVEALFEAGLTDDSRRLAQALIATPGLEPFGRFFLGRIAAASGRHDTALEQLQRAVELFPEWGAAHYALARSYRAVGQADAARDALARHARYGPAWPGIDDPLSAAIAGIREDGRAILARGIALASRGDIPGAIAAHEDALLRDPALSQAHANLISLYGGRQEWSRAEAHYRAVVALGDVGNAHYDYGVLLGMQQRWDEAVAAYRLAIGVNPLDARAHNNLAEALERQNDFDGALEEYRRAVTCDPGFQLARFNVGRLLLRAGKTDEALAELTKLADATGPAAPRMLFALSVASYRAGRTADAAAWGKKARELALAHGQPDLAAAIERDLAKLK
jgi:tetratricopeptide (TPR) repeat protein